MKLLKPNDSELIFCGFLVLLIEFSFDYTIHIFVSVVVDYHIEELNQFENLTSVLHKLPNLPALSI